jgi:hypothetical protein
MKCNNLDLFDTRYNNLDLYEPRYNHLTSQLICSNTGYSCLRPAFSFCRSGKRKLSTRAGLNSRAVPEQYMYLRSAMLPSLLQTAHFIVKLTPATDVALFPDRPAAVAGNSRPLFHLSLTCFIEMSRSADPPLLSMPHEMRMCFRWRCSAGIAEMPCLVFSWSLCGQDSRALQRVPETRVTRLEPSTSDSFAEDVALRVQNNSCSVRRCIILYITTREFFSISQFIKEKWQYYMAFINSCFFKCAHLRVSSEL